MTTYRRVRCRGPEPDARAVDAGRRALEAGAVLAHPTETVYGLGAGPPRRDGAVARLKGRDPDRPMLRIGPDAGTIRRSHPAVRWPERAELLAARFWPGPLTLVLPDGTDDGLAVRAEGHPVTRAVLEAAGRTMSSTSLNRSGEAPARSPREVARALDAMPSADADVLWLDAGALEASPPSTIVSLLGDRPVVLRAGAVDPGRVEACLGEEFERG